MILVTVDLPVTKNINNSTPLKQPVVVKLIVFFIFLS